MSSFKILWLIFYMNSIVGRTFVHGASETGESRKIIPENCPNLPKLGVLPGSGWDDLRNIEMAPVVAITYKQCKTTIDGKYLIPDHSFVIPIRNSDVSIYSIRASGSFSYEYQSLKQRQIDDKSVTLQVSARYTLYKVGIDPVDNLDPDLQSLFYGAIDAINSNDEEKADLIIQLIVRDYGTHVVNRVDAGAIVVKEDYVHRDFVMSSTENRETIKVTASASFFSIYNFGASYKQKVDDQVITAYNKNITSSQVRSYGGTLFKPGMNVSDWIDTVNDNLVSIDRSGEPLFFLITPQAFPNVSMGIVNVLKSKLERVIFLYYSRNGHKGCMDVGSPNFEYNANIDDSCKPSTNNYTFGGVFQNCQSPSGFLEDLCAPVRSKNIFTGGFNCKFPYHPVVLRNGTMRVSGRTCTETCSGWWLWRKCHPCLPVATYVTYQGYWCTAEQTVQTTNTEEMFGGLYTSKAENPVTKALSCPPTFLDVKILQDLHVCLGTDYELGIKYSVDFGGFFSCENGNPLINILKKRISTVLRDDEVDALLKSCPNGYTQHVATIEDDCLVYYCVKANSFIKHGELPVIVPPFKNFTMDDSSTWHNIINRSSPKQNSTGNYLVGIVMGVAATIVMVVFVFGGLWLYQKRKLREVRAISIENDNDNSNVQLVDGDGNQRDSDLLISS